MKHEITSWWETLQQKIATSPNAVTEIVVAGGVGMGVGFLFRTMGRYIFFACITVVVVACAFEYFHFITIEWATLKSLVGLRAVQTPADLWYELSLMIKENVSIVVAGVVGFLFGWKLGA